ncbi:MAG: hypothetical protein KAW47_11160 [Thermoplasmatales archaeon]|nr:hypothetical protein [Thermoplasmatales archaeon]
MNNEEFNRCLEEQLIRIRKTLGKKGIEYTVDSTDRIHNFRRAADTLGCCPERALIGMAVKHWISILDIVDEISSSGKYPTKELIEEKIGDMVNYMLILESTIKEVIRRDALDSPNIAVGYDAAIKIKDDVVRGICKCKSCRKSASVTTGNEESGYKHQRVN